MSAGGVDQLRGSHLVPYSNCYWSAPHDPACLIELGLTAVWAWGGSWVFDARSVTARDENQSRGLCELSWQPGVPPGSALGAPWTDWLPAGADRVEFAGLTSAGDLYWSKVGLVEGRMQHLGTASISHAGGYRAVALLGPGRLAGATAAGVIHWLRVRDNRFTEWAAPQALSDTAPV